MMVLLLLMMIPDGMVRPVVVFHTLYLCVAHHTAQWKRTRGYGLDNHHCQYVHDCDQNPDNCDADDDHHDNFGVAHNTAQWKRTRGYSLYNHHCRYDHD